MTDRPEPKPVQPWLKGALEYGPLILFFAVFMLWRNHPVQIMGREYSGMILATAVFVPVMALATLALWRLTGRLAPMQLVSLVLIVVFGGLTVWLNDPKFFKMKPTIIYLLFAAVLGFGWLSGRNWLRLVMNDALPMQHEGWRILEFRMILLFLGLAAANEVVWRTMSDTAWVNFKTFGLPILMVGFFMANSALFKRYGTDKDQ